MSCMVLKDAAHDYFLDLLSPAEKARIDGHVAGCEECADFMRICKELSCREFVEFLNEYCDGELDAERRAVFERHLSICPDCTAYLDSYRRTMALSRHVLAGRAPFPEGPIPEVLVRAVLDARRTIHEGGGTG